MGQVRGGTRRLPALAAVGLAAMLAAGCSAGDAGDAGSGKAGSSADQVSGARTAAGMSAPEAGKVEPGGAGGQLLQRSIVYTGTVTVRVPDVSKAADDITRTAETAGGFVGGDQRQSEGGRAQASLTVRVPAAKFGSVLDQIGKTGKELSRQFSTEDVTGQVIDLDARLATQQASVARTRALLARAKTVGEIISIESELAKREADLEAMEAKKRNLDDLTAMSTITVNLLGPEAAAPAVKDSGGFLAGLSAGWHALVKSLNVLVLVLGALLPWLIALGVPVAVVIWLVRRAGRRGRAVPAPAAETAAP